MPKEPTTVPKPQPAQPQEPSVNDPQPYKDPVKPPPADPLEGGQRVPASEPELKSRGTQYVGNEGLR